MTQPVNKGGNYELENSGKISQNKWGFSCLFFLGGGNVSNNSGWMGARCFVSFESILSSSAF